MFRLHPPFTPVRARLYRVIVQHLSMYFGSVITSVNNLWFYYIRAQSTLQVTLRVITNKSGSFAARHLTKANIAIHH